MVKTLVTFLLILLSLDVTSQDERFFRSYFSGDLKKFDNKVAVKKSHFKTYSPFYLIDLNGDYKNERILVEKRDGDDFIHIYDYKRNKLFEYKFETLGLDSELFKISLKVLSSKVSVLVLHFYEGHTKYIKKRGSGRLYYLSFENGDFSTFSMFKGPKFWEEKSNLRDHYHQRAYTVGSKDYNKDGIKELVVRFRDIFNVYFYNGKGRWVSKF